MPTITDGINYVNKNFLQPTLTYTKNNKLFVVSCIFSAIVNPTFFFGATAASTCLYSLANRVTYKVRNRLGSVNVQRITTYSPNVRMSFPFFAHYTTLALQIANKFNPEKAQECLKVFSAKVGLSEIPFSEFIRKFSNFACIFNGFILGREIAKIITIGVENKPRNAAVSMGAFTWTYQVHAK